MYRNIVDIVLIRLDSEKLHLLSPGTLKARIW